MSEDTENKTDTVEQPEIEVPENEAPAERQKNHYYIDEYDNAAVLVSYLLGRPGFQNYTGYVGDDSIVIISDEELAVELPFEGLAPHGQSELGRTKNKYNMQQAAYEAVVEAMPQAQKDLRARVKDEATALGYKAFSDSRQFVFIAGSLVRRYDIPVVASNALSALLQPVEKPKATKKK